MNIQFLKNMNDKEKRLLFIILALVGLWLTYAFAMEPLYKNWLKLDKEIEVAKMKLQKTANWEL